MSRVGTTIIQVPKGVTVVKIAHAVEINGPKGTLNLNIPSGLDVALTPHQVEVKITTQDRKLGNIHGLVRSLLSNAILGVSTGWQKTVELVGVGYRAQGGGNEVTLLVGFTHPVKISAPVSVTFQVIDTTKIVISGIDKILVGEIAAKLRSVKPPEPYKGKGIRYLGEIVRKKAGKAVKAAGSPA